MSFLDEPRLVRVARVEFPMAAGIRTVETVARRCEMRRGVLDGFRAVQLRRFCAAAVHVVARALQPALPNVGRC